MTMSIVFLSQSMDTSECFSLPPLTGAATDVSFSPSNNMLMVSVGLDAKIKCYDIQTRKLATFSPT